MFGAFLLCALVPTAGIAGLSFFHVTRELERQEQLRLHHASRATGMLVIERLLAVTSDLEPLAAATSPPANAQAIPVMLRARLRSLGWVRRDGRVSAVLGAPQKLPALTAQDEEALARGRVLLRTVREASGRPHVILLVSSPRAPSQPRLEAELRPDYLFDISEENTLPPSGQFCVLDAHHDPLTCSAGASGVAASTSLDSSKEGAFEWRAAQREYIGYAWPLFLRASFGHPSWTAVVLEPRKLVLAPLTTFDRILAQVTIASALLVALLSAWLIRRRLEPLEQLRDGTRRLAEGDFGSPVQVSSPDEIGELADSFNGMADRLQTQLQSLAILVDTDRRILSSVDDDGIARSLLAGLSALAPDREALALLLPPPGDEAPVPRLWRASRRLGAAKLLPGVRRDAFSALRGETGWQRAGIEELPDALRRSLGDTDAEEVVLLPLVARGALLGVALIPSGGEPEEGLVYAQRLANQAAVALHAARMRASNRRLLYFDSVTGLPSRRRLVEELEFRLGGGAGRGQSRGTLCLLGIRDFERVSDTLGQDAGDALLKTLATRACEVVPAHRITRLAGPELVLLLDEPASAREIESFMDTLIHRVEGPVRLGDQEVYLSVAVGVVRCPEDGADAQTLLRNGGAALAQARRRRAPKPVFYAGEMRREASARLRDEADLRRAIEREELRLYFQPMVDVTSRALIGAEALVRWQHPDRGLVGPDEFVGVAEEGGLITALGEWVLGEACRRLRGWRERGAPYFRLHVNLSPFQIRRGDFLEIFDRVLAEEGVEGSALGIELTEGALIDGDDSTLRLLEGLRSRGAALSIDDFGTGYSALGYLKRFPIDALKLDKSFVLGLPERTEDVAIAQAVVAMASGLGLQVVAEGVEREEQLTFLRKLGCQVAQGFLFSPPLPPDGFAKALGRWQLDTDRAFPSG